MSVIMECKHRNGIYSELKVKFTGGRASVSDEKFAEMKAHKLYGSEFAKLGELANPAGIAQPVKVVRGGSTDSNADDSSRIPPEERTPVVPAPKKTK